MQLKKTLSKTKRQCRKRWLSSLSSNTKQIVHAGSLKLKEILSRYDLIFSDLKEWGQKNVLFYMHYRNWETNSSQQLIK